MNPADPLSDLTILIPLWNEAAVIEHVLDEIQGAALLSAANVLLLDDGSADSTSDVIRRWRIRNPNPRIGLVSLPHGGKDLALWHGFSVVQTEWLGVMDGDGQYAPEDFSRLIEAARQKGSAAVWGIRVNRHDRGWRLLISQWGRWFKRAIMGACRVTDTGCGIWVARTAYVREVGRLCPHPSGQVHCHLPEFIAAQGGQVGEMPIIHRERYAGQAKFGALNRVWPGLQSLWQGRRLCRRARPGPAGPHPERP